MPEILYGFTGNDIENAKAILEEIFSIKMEGHDSLYHGGNYYLFEDGGDKLILKKNVDLVDDSEVEFKEFPILLQVESSKFDKSVLIENQFKILDK